MNLKYFHYKKVKSTNDIAIREIKKNQKNGIIIADKQTKGRGRYGKRWVSYKGNILVSIFFKINKKISINKLNKLNITLIKKALSKMIKENIMIKPPNDLLINKKKFAGILQETLINDNIKYIIIGIGINLVKNPSIKNYPTTNLLKETKKQISKKKLIKTICNEFKKNQKKFALHA